MTSAPALAFAGLSARSMAEAGVREGFSAVALDLFGDQDTRRLAQAWQRIGEAAQLRIDPAALLASLRSLAIRTDLIGWIAGSGFEAAPELLDAGGGILRLIGNPGKVVRAVRDREHFFGVLARHGVPHPATRLVPPGRPEGWFLKDMSACGGGHVRPVTPEQARLPPPASCVFQAIVAGEPMSVTFIANGSRAVVIGFNRQLTDSAAGMPCLHAGVIGPVPVPERVAAEVRTALDSLVESFSLRGLGSLDFMLSGASWQALEINPRPPASLGSYPGRGLMRAHVRACLRAELPDEGPLAQPVYGHRIIFAGKGVRIGRRTASSLAALAGLRDLPWPGTDIPPGAPVCTVTASGSTAIEVEAALLAQRAAIEQLVEPEA